MNIEIEPAKKKFPTFQDLLENNFERSSLKAQFSARKTEKTFQTHTQSLLRTMISSLNRDQISLESFGLEIVVQTPRAGAEEKSFKWNFG